MNQRQGTTEAGRRLRGRALSGHRQIAHVRAQPSMEEARNPRAGRRWWRWVAGLYLVLLVASHLAQLARPAAPPLAGTHSVMLASATPGKPNERVVFMDWDGTHPWHGESPGGEVAHDSRPAVLLIHGSPGRASLFATMAPLIAEAGYRVVAVDLPGFGDSSLDIVDHSMLAHSGRVLKLMDALHIARAHVVGWSNGGGVALHMADVAPERVASLTMLAAVGDQAMEGSGSYAFEHFKYALGFGAIGGLPEVVPHFGKLGSFGGRTGFLKNFWDSDQRPLRGIMERLTLPTLIVHGRQDCLIAVEAARRHHELIRNSSVVLMRANHFLPLMQPAETAGSLVPFFERHDEPGQPEPRAVVSKNPEPEHKGLMAALHNWRAWINKVPWWVQVGVISKIVLVAPTLGIVACVWLVSTQSVDYLVALVGIVVGLVYQTGLLLILGRVLGLRAYKVPYFGKRLARVSEVDWVRRMATKPGREGWTGALIARERASSVLGAVLFKPSLAALSTFLVARIGGILVWSLVSYGVALAGMVGAYRFFHRVTTPELLFVAAALAIAVRWAPMLLVRRGRQSLLAWWERLRHYEYWPAWVFYFPLAPYIAWLALKHRSASAPTCCNPGIEYGGGLVGESKASIMRQLGDHPAVLPTLPIEAGDVEQRVRDTLAAMTRAEFAFPVVLKPDAGQRGFGVKLARNEQDLRRYYQTMTGRAIVQPYHAGPCEVGVLWARHVGPSVDGLEGFIYSITRKEFPVLVGDGVHTIHELIYAHPRYRRQAAVFLDRLADRASEVLDKDEDLALGIAGNHCQGTLFRDGGDLITPELTAAMNRLAQSFNGGLDFGRFDLRYSNDDELRKGDGFAVVELNGTTSESTNLYDPAKNLAWAYGVLFGQWRLLFELGAARQRRGARGLGLHEVLRAVWVHYRARRGSAVSD